MRGPSPDLDTRPLLRAEPFVLGLSDPDLTGMRPGKSVDQMRRYSNRRRILLFRSPTVRCAQRPCCDRRSAQPQDQQFRPGCADHPLLIELGLLDRLLFLIKAGEERLFPEWKQFARGDGTTRWSQPITKSWQYVKKVLKFVRADLTLYATRHLMADWLDNSTIAKRTRDRILGHVTDVPGGYGRKGSINADQMAAISALEPEIVKQMREILVAAKDRAERAELIVLKPQSKKRAGVAKGSESCPNRMAPTAIAGKRTPRSRLYSEWRVTQIKLRTRISLKHLYNL